MLAMGRAIRHSPKWIGGAALVSLRGSAKRWSSEVVGGGGGEEIVDIDVGSLFCHRHNKCFLMDGKLCSSFQHQGRSRGVLQVTDLSIH